MKVILGKKRKKREGKLEKKWKNEQKKGKNTVDYCCNLQWFRCGGTVIPPHHLDIVIIYSIVNLQASYSIDRIRKKLNITKKIFK